MRKPWPPRLTRDPAPGKLEGQPQPHRAGGSARGVGMTVSNRVPSPPRPPISRAGRSPRRRLARPPLQFLGGSPHSRGLKGGRVSTRIAAGSADSSCGKAGRLLRNPGRAQLSRRLRRLVNLPPSEAPGGACSYLLAQAATGAMAAKDAEPSDGPRGLAPRLRSGHAEWLWKGRKQDSRRAPANHQAPPIPTGFSFSCKTPGGGAGTLAGAPSLRQRWDIYIFLGWSLPLAEKARLRGNWRAAVPCLAHLRQPRRSPA
ncbi:uncharacterized protein LOC144370531 [Ictidomys tridecemlineatus]